MKPLRVLLIEDDATTRDALMEILAREDFEVVPAVDGQEGLDQLERQDPQIVVTDLRLPKVDGLEIMRTVKRTHADVPVILVTGYGETDVAIEALQLGAMDYLRKPVDVGELLVALGRAREFVHRAQSIKTFPTILLAEDDQVARTHLADVLRREGYHVSAAQDGQEAVAQFGQTKIDIALLDIKMPKLDGLRALGKMRAQADDFEAIILTGFGDETAAVKAMREGAMGFIRKPVDLDELFATIESAMNRLSMQRALRYRQREVDLAAEIIAQLTEHEQIMVRLPGGALARSKAMVTQLVEHSSDCVLVVDAEDQVLYANQRTEFVLGQRPTRTDRDFADAVSRRSAGALSSDAVQKLLAGAHVGPLGVVQSLDPTDAVSVVCVGARVSTAGQASDYLLVYLRGLLSAG